MPSSRAAQMTRSAISPRLAIRIFLNIIYRGASPLGLPCTLSRGGPAAPLRSRGSRCSPSRASPLGLPCTPPSPASGSPNREQAVVELHRLAVLDEDLLDDAVDLALDLVHQL